jgi:hypothetical protein
VAQQLPLAQQPPLVQQPLKVQQPLPVQQLLKHQQLQLLVGEVVVAVERQLLPPEQKLGLVQPHVLVVNAMDAMVIVQQKNVWLMTQNVQTVVEHVDGYLFQIQMLVKKVNQTLFGHHLVHALLAVCVIMEIHQQKVKRMEK